MADKVIEEALTRASGNWELVARGLAFAAVTLMVESEQPPAKRKRGRPARGVQIPVKSRTEFRKQRNRTRGAPQRHALPHATKDHVQRASEYMDQHETMAPISAARIELARHGIPASQNQQLARHLAKRISEHRRKRPQRMSELALLERVFLK